MEDFDANMSGFDADDADDSGVPLSMKHFFHKHRLLQGAEGGAKYVSTSDNMCYVIAYFKMHLVN